MKVITTRVTLPANSRYALYIDSDLGKQVREFHKKENDGKPLWFSAEAVVKAGLRSLGIAVEDDDIAA